MDLIGKTMVAEVLLHVNNLWVHLELLFLVVSSFLLLHLHFLLVLLSLVLVLQAHQLAQIVQISHLLLLLLYHQGVAIGHTLALLLIAHRLLQDLLILLYFLYQGFVFIWEGILWHFSFNRNIWIWQMVDILCPL